MAPDWEKTAAIVTDGWGGPMSAGGPRKGGFKSGKLALQPIVSGIGDLWRRLLKIQSILAGNFPSQRFDSLPGLGRRICGEGDAGTSDSN
jgi:hypothetical protein